VLRIPFLKQSVQTFDAWQRPFLQVWFVAQQTVFAQHVSLLEQEPFPQQSG
jgi:hypothetical protein